MADILCPQCGEPVDEADEEQYAAEPCDFCTDKANEKLQNLPGFE